MEEKERFANKCLTVFARNFRRKNLFPFRNVLRLFAILTFSSKIHAEILKAPRFITQPSSTSNIVNENANKILLCQAIGNPDPVYKWLKDGIELTGFSSEQYYKIESARREDAGSYQCIAKNDVGSILSQKIHVTVAYMGSFTNLSEQLVVVDEGDAAILNLPEIESYPEPLVNWTADDGSFFSQNEYDYVISSTNQLIVLSASERHQKSYRAHITNTQLGSTVTSPYIRLEVRRVYSGFSEPKLIVAPQDLNMVRGKQTSNLYCIANISPLQLLSINWLKDGVPLENSGISHQFSRYRDQVLTLYNANLTHTGKYRCEVKISNTNVPPIVAEAYVTVQEPPSISTNILPQETIEELNSVVKFPCEAIGIPTPNITWYRNAVDISRVTTHNRYTVEDGTLVIKKLRVEDSGLFQCFASNDVGTDFIFTWLKVKTSAPLMEIPPQNVVVLDGKDATISCRVTGAPAPNVTWYHNGTLPIIQNHRFQFLEDGDLLILGVKVEDTGEYTCVRSNEAGSVQGSATLSVRVRTQIIKPPEDTRVLLGQKATLQCKVSGDPSVPYQIDWYFNKKTLIIGSGRTKVTSDGLEMNAVRSSDIGEYTCVLQSPAGNETRSARLNVIELPYSPTLMVAERVANRSVNVSWAPAFDGNSPLLKYIVQKREVSDLGPILDPMFNWVTELSNVSANVNSVLLTNLKAAVSYQFRVSAVNSVGEGQPSNASNIVQIPQEPPSGPPIGFAGSARSSSEIITQWQPPMEETRNGRITGYVIRYRLSGYNHSPWTYQNITNEVQRNYLIQELITYKDYVLQIAAYNDKGVGIFSDPIKIKTKEGVPEAPPRDVDVKPLNSTAILVSWKPPNPQHINGINQGYKIQAWEGDAVSHTITVAPSLLDQWALQSAIMTNLNKFTDYNVTVLCFTAPGDGPCSQPVAVKTNEDVPSEIGNLQFQNISDRAVTVLWSPPKSSNGILKGYTVSYMMKDQPDSLKVLNFTADKLQVEIKHLKSKSTKDSFLHIIDQNTNNQYIRTIWVHRPQHVHVFVVDCSLKNAKYLQATTHYKIEVFAWTQVGSGPSTIAVIQSGVEPVLPHPPTKLAITNIEAFSVVLQFTPGFDGNSSISKWVVEAQTVRNSSWFPVYEESSPEATTLFVSNLVPFTTYKLRLKASNVVGASDPSDATKEFQTIQAPPAHPPYNVTVRAMSATELRVRWIPLQQTEWFGYARGYNISFREISLGPGITREVSLPAFTVTIEDPTSNSYILDSLEAFAQYEVRMIAFNDVGFSMPSPPAIERTRESVPSSGPENVVANTTSSTTIVVRWGNIPVEHQNGQIEGFKVYYGLSSRASHPVQVKTIPSNSTFTATLTELRKYVQYSIQVLAYTRLGDGALSSPPVRVETFDDTPGPPSNVSFPDVSLTTARIRWDDPEEPNGIILAYRVDYHLQNDPRENVSREFPQSDRTFRWLDLKQEQYYMFMVTAQTRLGWGKTAYALVFTTNNRERPLPPSSPQISRGQVQANQITFSWTPGRDGFAPLRYYSVQKSENSGQWTVVPERVDPSATSFTVTDLQPFTNYRFRIQATNDIGPSGYSQESPQVRTLPAAPSKGVENVKIVPITTTSVHVHWEPVSEQYWSGDLDTGGYNILFQPVTDFPNSLQVIPKQQVKGTQSSEVILNDLTRDQNYEVIVEPFNSQGTGPSSRPIAVYVGEAVPTGPPRNVEAEAVSATEVRLKWLPPQHNQTNGDLLGFKIFYLATESPQEEELKIEEETEVVPASYTSHNLIFLDKYTKYRIQILAFNPAGDGPRSELITVKTHQGIPGPPIDLKFSEITMNSLVVSWLPPKKRNGELIGYLVTYETAEQNEEFSKQVRQKVTETNLLIQTLEEEVTYMFTVRAQTIDFGPPIRGNVTTGPQDGSPARLREISLSKTISSFDIKWANGVSGKGPILGYYIQTKKKDENRWTTVVRTNNGPIDEFPVSYQNLLPSTMYSFRVFAYNKYGISYPLTADDVVVTPSKLYLEYGYLKMAPFYRRSWFVVALAAGSIIIIILVVAMLCVKSKSYKYKQEAQRVLEESLAMDIDDRQQLAMEMYRSRRLSTAPSTHGSTGTLSRRNTLNRKSQYGAGSVPKAPPRPSPANVVYHSDDESVKGYDENPDDSSVTEKASELSSTDTQNSDGENDSVHSDPHSFVNHYANVNDSLRQSWKRQKPVRNYSSYTDSEPEGSAVVSLNGGQIVMNNMARSRAPLPGFSSFV